MTDNFNWLKEAEGLVYGGGRDYAHPLIQHLNAGLRQCVRSAAKGRSDPSLDNDPITVAENATYMKQSRNDGKEKIDNWVDGGGYIACINRMADLYIELGHAEDQLEAINSLRQLDFHEMFELMMEAIKHESYRNINRWIKENKSTRDVTEVVFPIEPYEQPPTNDHKIVCRFDWVDGEECACISTDGGEIFVGMPIEPDEQPCDCKHDCASDKKIGFDWITKEQIEELKERISPMQDLHNFYHPKGRIED